jgi:hypothetical protein
MTPLAFLLNRYTWISMRADTASQTQDLESATQAARDSSRPCRVAMLVHDSDQAHNMIKTTTPRVRKHILATINAQASALFTLDDAEFPQKDEARPLHATPAPVILVVIENAAAPGYDLCHIQSALDGERGIEVHPPPHKYFCPPPDTSEPGLARQMQDRHHPLLQSSQTWCCAAHQYTLPSHAYEEKKVAHDRIPDPRSAGDRLDPILGLLGINPKGLKSQISSYGGVTPPPDTLKRISLLVLNTSITIYRRSEAFQRWRQKT